MTVHVAGSVADVVGRGLSGVLVSNGEAVVQTDAHGRYALDAEPGAHSFIFVTVPDSYSARDRFFRPVPALSARVDFTLEPAPERMSRRFSLAHISDTHLGVEPERVPTENLLVKDLLQLADDADPDLIVATGDLTETGTLAELRLFRNAVGRVGRPVVPLWGGHDSASEHAENGAGRTSTRNYERVLGPVNYSFDWGGRHFVAYAAQDEFFSAEHAERKDRWLFRDLETRAVDREAIVLMHPPPPVELLERLAGYNVSLVLHGHTHISKVFAHAGITVASLTPLCFGGIDTNPRGYRAVAFTEDGFELELRALGGQQPSPRRPRRLGAGPPESARRPMWERKLPASLHRAAPVARDGDLLLSLSDEHSGSRAGVYCVAGDSGEPKWHAQTDSSVKNSVALGEDGLTVALSMTGRVHGLDARSGTTLWRADLPVYPEARVATSPVIVGDTVYAGAEFGYGAFDLHSGDLRWYTPLEGVNRPCFASPQVCDDLLIVMVRNRGLLALGRSDGRTVWERSIGVEFQYPPPLLSGDLLVSGGDPGDLVALDARSGELMWQRRLIEYTWAPGTSKYLKDDAEWGYPYPTGMTIVDDRLYVTTSGGEVLCCDLRTGAELWRFQSGDDLLDMTPHRRGIQSILAGPMLVGDALMVGGVDGVLYLLDPATGECAERVQLPGPIAARPCVLEDGFCVGTWDGRLYRFADR